MTSLFWMRRSTRRNGKWYLSWHSYRTAAAREKWAAIYRARGDGVWEQPLLFLPRRSTPEGE